jgi:hypothetical protein
MRNKSAFQPTGNTKAYYPLNGNSTDFSGNVNTGTDTAITYPAGRFGQGARFDGTTSRIDIGTGWSFQNQSFTVHFWVFPTKGSTSRGIVLGQGTSATANNALHIGQRDTGGFTMAFYADDIESSSQVIQNRWQLWTATYDSATKVQCLYLNGNFDATRTASANFTGTGTVMLGRQQFSSGQSTSYFGGTIDEVIIESRAWTAKEVETYYRKSMQNYKQSFFAKLLQAFSITDTLSLSETSTNLRARNFTATDTLSLSEVITALKGLAFTVSDTLHLTEAFTATRTFVFNVADTLGLTDLTDFIFKWNKVNKPSSSWEQSTKPSTTFTSTSKGSSIWTKKNKS